MRKLVCPQCKMPYMYLKDTNGNRLPIYILDNGNIIPKNENDSMDGFNIEDIFCLGCSWHGIAKKMVKY